MAPDVLAASLYPLLLQTDIFDKVLLHTRYLSEYPYQLMMLA